MISVCAAFMAAEEESKKKSERLKHAWDLELLQKSEVFLNEASPLFLWFKKKNVSVRSNHAMDSKKSTEETLEKK